MKALLEIGVEEVPARFLPGARKDLFLLAEESFSRAGLSGLEIESYSSSRHLVLEIDELPERTPDSIEELRGPPIGVAFDEEGNPTKAALGFARRAGVEVSDLTRDGAHLLARKGIPGMPMIEFLAGEMPRWISLIPWAKSQRFSGGTERFVRPVRWILAILEREIVPFEWAGIRSGRETFVRKISGGGPVLEPVEIPSSGLLRAFLRENRTEADDATRRMMVDIYLREAAERIGGDIVWAEGDKEGTLGYLADIVEMPRVIDSDFDESYTSLPREVLILTMWKHQRFVPIERNGSLVNKFLIVANEGFGRGPNFDENIREGNRRVLSARLADARFFWDNDLSRPLEETVEDLRGTVFHAGLGSVHERVMRLVHASSSIAKRLGLDDRMIDVKRAALLAKADLATSMVYEFPELEGTIGRRLAERQGEKAEVAEATETHYLPRGSGCEVPTGIAVPIALADRAELLLSCLLAGETPTGSKDPFGLRRAAIGIIRIILGDGEPSKGPVGIGANEVLLSARSALEAGGLKVSDEIFEKAMAFLRERFSNYLAERIGARSDIVEAVLSAGWYDLSDALERVKAVEDFRKEPDFEDICVSFKRVMNIIEKEIPTDEIQEGLFETEEERRLLDETNRLAREIGELRARGDHSGVMRTMAAIRPVVDGFFEAVLVNCPDEERSGNRKALLGRLARLFVSYLSFSKITVG